MTANAHPRQRAVAWLARREYSVAELRQRLSRCGYEPEAVSATIDWLEANDLVSDARFAEALIRSRVGKGYGPRWIEHRLREKGVAAAEVRLALDAAAPDWRLVARRACVKRFGGGPWADLKDKSRRVRYLSGRGFNHEQIDYALNLDDEEQR